MGSRRLALVGGLLVALVALTACEKVDKPTSDSTAPLLKWTVNNTSTSETKEIAGSGTIQATVGHHFTVTLKAEDPQGIHEITISVSTGWQCVQGNLQKNAGPGLGAQKKQTLEPDSQGKVLTSIVLLESVTMGPYDCQSGYQATSGASTFEGSGTNYFNGKTNGTLTITA